jgi:hypothetical protein
MLGEKVLYKSSKKDLPIKVHKDFYDQLLFHGNRFRRIGNFKEADHMGSFAPLNLDNITDDWFGSTFSQNLVLKSPGINDAIIHCHQVCRPHVQLLPNSVEKIQMNLVDCPVKAIRTQEESEKNGSTIITSWLIGENNQVIQKWTSLELTPVKSIKKEINWNPTFLKSSLNYILKNGDHKFKLLDTKSLKYICQQINSGALKPYVLTLEDGSTLHFQKNPEKTESRHPRIFNANGEQIDLEFR